MSDQQSNVGWRGDVSEHDMLVWVPEIEALPRVSLGVFRRALVWRKCPPSLHGQRRLRERWSTMHWRAAWVRPTCRRMQSGVAPRGATKMHLAIIVKLRVRQSLPIWSSQIGKL